MPSSTGPNEWTVARTCAPSFPDLQDLVAGMDRKLRLAPGLARGLGWSAPTASGWVVVVEGRTGRRAAEHRELLRAAFPADGRTLRRWLREPTGTVRPWVCRQAAQAGVDTDVDLLERGGTRKGREELALTTGLRPEQILEWVNHADLMRVKGVGAEYADLLEAAGAQR